MGVRVGPCGVCPSCLCVFTMEETTRKPRLESWLYRFLAVWFWAIGKKISLSLSHLGSKMGLKCLPLRGTLTYWRNKKMLKVKRNASYRTGSQEGVGYSLGGVALCIWGYGFRYMQVGTGRCI